MLEQTPREQRQRLIDTNHAELSLRRQCELLQVNRSTFYYKATKINADDLDLVNEIREIWERYPFYGYRRITKELQFKGHKINRKRVQRLMQLAGIQADIPRPKHKSAEQVACSSPLFIEGDGDHSPQSGVDG